MKKRRKITKRYFALFLALLLALNTLTVSAGEIVGGAAATQESSDGSETSQGGGETKAETPAPEEPKPEGDGANAETPAPAPEEPKPEGDGANTETPAPGPGEVKPDVDGANTETPAPGTEVPNPDGDAADPALPPEGTDVTVPDPPALDVVEPADPDEGREIATYTVTFAVENPESGVIRVEGEAVDAASYSKDVEEGNDFTFQAEAMEGWAIGGVSANGEEVGKDGDSYVIRGIAGDTAIAVSFTESPEEPGAEEELPQKYRRSWMQWPGYRKR